MANTPNFALYKPSRGDTSVEVDTSLSDNFTKIDTELKTNKDDITTHKNNPSAHTSENITHADGSVRTILDNHEERIGGLETDADALEIRVNDIETLGLDVLAPTLEGRIQTIESDVEGFLAPATFDAMDQQSYTFDEYRIGYVDNKLAEKPVKTLSDLTSSLTLGKNLMVMNGTYTLTADLTSMSNGIVIEGQNNTIIDGGGKSINISNLQNVIFKNIIFQNFGNIQLTNPVNVEFNHCQFNNFVTYGVTPINYTNVRFVNGCKWNGIGNSTVNETYQGAGIYANGGTGLVVEDFEMSNTYGQGAIFLVGGATNFSIKRFNIHDTAFRGINSFSGTYTGAIEDGYIYNTGTINTKGSGVGCNGIFGYATGDQSGVVARNLRFKNIYENAMECGYGMIEDIIIDGTGTDLTNHPTPSIEGIWIQQQAYLKVIRNVRIRNAAGAGIKFFSATEAVRNLHIYNVTVEDDNPNLSSYGLDLNIQSTYSNLIVEGLTVYNKTPTFMVNKPCTQPVYVSGVRSIASGASLPNVNQLRTKDGVLSNSIQNKDFSSWATTTSLTNWTAQSAALAQVVDDNSYIPQLTVNAGGFPGRIVQNIYLPKGSKTYYLRVMFKGNTNLVMKVTPYNIDGTTLNNGAANTFTSSSFSTSAFQEVTLMYTTTSSMVQVYFGTQSSTQNDYIIIQSIQERIIY